MGKNDVIASFVMDNLKPALLTRAELSWLCDSTLPLSKNYQRQFRSSIKKKVWILTDLELPLLAQKGFLNYGPVISADVTAGCSGVTIDCNVNQPMSSLVKVPAADRACCNENSVQYGTQKKESDIQALNGPGRIRTNDPRHVKAVS